MSPSTVAYIWSPELQKVSDHLPSNIGRSSIVHALIQSLNLLDDEPAKSSGECHPATARVVAPDPASMTREQLLKYHTPAYVDYLLDDRASASVDDVSDNDSDASSAGPPSKRSKTERHGLEHDCPPFPQLPSYALQIASATLTACRLLAKADVSIAINWDGGRHHSFRDRASGFCYVADIVLGIMLLIKEGKTKKTSVQRSPGPIAAPRTTTVVQGVLREQRNRRPRVMYLDLDLHYGDGVALAFHSPTAYAPGRKSARPPQVLTLSIHHSAPTFFPPPNTLSLLPDADTTSPFSLAIPLRAYPSASTYAALLPSIQRVYEAYQPDYIVLQLGSDGLPGDPVGQYGNWSTHGEGGMISIAQHVLEWNLPICVLGGGGYRSMDTARAWAGVTAAMLRRRINEDAEIPHHEFFPEYAPNFTMEVQKGSVRDENTLEYLGEVDERYKTIASRIKSIIDTHA